jgi:hypothetical protein
MKKSILLIPFVMSLSCQRNVEPLSAAPQFVTSDQQLFAFITHTQPFSSYALFPRADSVVSGTLNGSHAHQPRVRVVMNAVAQGALPDGLPPPGLSFPEGSVIVKEVRVAGVATIYAVVFKESDNPLSNGGWVWAEYYPNGTVVFSIERRGSGCVSCHSREKGPQHDLIRTFERQIR